MRPSSVMQSLQFLMDIDGAVMLHGASGVGKSDTVRQFGKKVNRKVFDIRLSLIEPTDLRGLPYFDPETKKAKWGEASILPTEEDGPSILFLDELNVAHTSIQATAYQLVLDKKIGEYSLPKDCFVVAAGNRDSDGGVTYKIPGPLRGRFTHIMFDNNIDDFLNWAFDNEIHSSITGFLSFAPSNLHKFDNKSLELAFPSPRSWAKVSNIKKNQDINNIDKSIINELIAGTIGQGMQVEYTAYCENYEYLPKMDDVAKGIVKEFHKNITQTNKDISIHYAFVTGMISYLKMNADSPDIVNYSDNFIQFILNNLSAELGILSLRLVTNAFDKDPFRNAKSYKNIVEKYGKYIR